MSRLLFYNIAASIFAVGVAQLAATVTSIAPDPVVQRAKWQSTPATAAVIRALGPFEVQAAVLCSLITVVSLPIEGSASAP